MYMVLLPIVVVYVLPFIYAHGHGGFIPLVW